MKEKPYKPCDQKHQTSELHDKINDSVHFGDYEISLKFSNVT